MPHVSENYRFTRYAPNSLSTRSNHFRWSAGRSGTKRHPSRTPKNALRIRRLVVRIPPNAPDTKSDAVLVIPRESLKRVENTDENISSVLKLEWRSRRARMPRSAFASAQLRGQARCLRGRDFIFHRRATGVGAGVQLAVHDGRRPLGVGRSRRTRVNARALRNGAGLHHCDVTQRSVLGVGRLGCRGVRERIATHRTLGEPRQPSADACLTRLGRRSVRVGSQDHDRNLRRRLTSRSFESCLVQEGHEVALRLVSGPD